MFASLVHRHIGLLADLFLGAAWCDGPCCEPEATYVQALLEDLLTTRQLPELLARHIIEFTPGAFDFSGAVARFQAEPPMSARRLLELVTYVALADGSLVADEDAYIRALGVGLGLAEDAYRDLTLDPINNYRRYHFIRQARIRLPNVR